MISPIRRTRFTCCLTLVVLAGCAKAPVTLSLGNTPVAATQQSIQDDRASLPDLIQRYGQPARILYSPQGKQIAIWLQNSQGTMASDEMTTQMTVLAENNRVHKHWVHRYPAQSDNSFLASATHASLGQVITKGISTETGLIARLGEPHSYLFDDDGNKIMMYIWRNKSTTAQGDSMKLLLICLTDKNVVKFFNLERFSGQGVNAPTLGVDA